MAARNGDASELKRDAANPGLKPTFRWENEDMEGIEEPEMTPDEFKARQEAGLPVRVVASKKEFQASLVDASGAVRVAASAISASGNTATGPGVAVSSASRL